MLEDPSRKAGSSQLSTKNPHKASPIICRPRHFNHQEILTGTENFLERVGYKLLPKSQTDNFYLDVYAQRSEGGKHFKIIGLVCTDLEQAGDSYTQLAAIKASLEHEADYVLIMPPINEYPVTQFLTADMGKWFHEIKKRQFMMWMYNPERETMWCIVGGPRDMMLNNYFVFANRPIDPYIGMLLSREMMKKGDF